MPQVYKAANVEEAILFANEFKAKGVYNLFRGQVCDWPPYSSLGRLELSGNKEALDAHMMSLLMFYNWLDSVEDISFLRDPENADQLTAVLQHYGIKTNFIDFTTDPSIAGFFAADGEPQPGRNACIYCIDSEDAKELFEDLQHVRNQEKQIFQFVDVDVSNLWRLQSQKGIFLHCNFNWDLYYPMDRIEFPYSGYPSYPSKEIIYPIHKSSLEQLLDQYFFIRQATFGNQKIKQLVDELESKGVKTGAFSMETPDQYFFPEAFLEPALLSEHTSWNAVLLRPWTIQHAENFDETVGSFEIIVLKQGGSDDENARSVGFAITQILQQGAHKRSKAIEWMFKNFPAHLNEEKLKSMLNRAWNGMRLLPFSNEEIARCFSMIFSLFASFKDASYTVRQIGAVLAAKTGGATLRIGFTNMDKSGSYGYAAEKSLLQAVVLDLEKLFRIEHVTRAANIRLTFAAIMNPRILFDFDKLRKIFADEIIPAQILEMRSLILFNPARLIILGNA